MKTFLLLALSACALSVASADAQNTDRSVIGKWKVTAVRDSAEIAALDEREANRLVGRIFTIAKDKVQFGTESCGPSDFAAQRVEVRLFLREEFRARADNLGLPNPATVVDLSCTTVFVKTANKLLIFWDGWFFDAVRLRE